MNGSCYNRFQLSFLDVRRFLQSRAERRSQNILGMITQKELVAVNKTSEPFLIRFAFTPAAQRRVVSDWPITAFTQTSTLTETSHTLKPVFSSCVIGKMHNYKKKNKRKLRLKHFLFLAMTETVLRGSISWHLRHQIKLKAILFIDWIIVVNVAKLIFTFIVFFFVFWFRP